MIESKDRSGWFGASDTDKVIGNWKTATFEKWWMQKIGINRDHFDNKYTSAGTHYEHRILESLGIPMEFDKQIIIEDLRLRVNLDGNDSDTIYECKTYGFDKGFKLPRKYINQVQVQMFASGLRKARIIVYGLTEKDYDNYFHDIDPERRDEIVIAYDERWVTEVYLPKLKILAECLKEGRFPV
jgi:hypothetical protein